MDPLETNPLETIHKPSIYSQCIDGFRSLNCDQRLRVRKNSVVFQLVWILHNSNFTFGFMLEISIPMVIYEII